MTILNSKRVFGFLQHAFLLIVRIAVGFAMLSHGFPKLKTLLDGGNIEFYNFLGLNSTISLSLTVFAEFVCSIFLILGLFTRYACFFLAFTMAFAAFVVHSGDIFEKQELAVVYFSLYLLLFAYGAGKFSIDNLIQKRRNSRIY